MRSLVVAALCVALPALAQEHDIPPQEDQGLICIDASPPIIPGPALDLVNRLANFEVPRNLSVAQFQRLQQASRHFAAGRERQALQHFGQAVTTAYVNLGHLGDRDIEALAFIVLMEAAKSAQEDLKAIMAGVKSINAQKAAVREHIGTLEEIAADGCEDDDDDAVERAPASADDHEIVDPCDDMLAQLERLRDQQDSLTEVSEELSLKLQMYQERNAKAVETLSNLMKKMSDTASGIVQNLK